MKFSTDGQYLASSGFDRLLYFWDVFPSVDLDETAPCKNIGVLKGHKNAVIELQWGGSNERLYTASSDR